ncbi:FUSC family protein [Hymenobacter psychrophilus]|uniref:Uncharacterized membrane protein YccC n=1 Tax=Hymenobacter psychrophilus TaxID=651662 RepID=A0A1H3KLW8_9BACT|nr:FUSC family membrane protein [Hymenobacter psychrophilus]SDY53183.1 Uncharacterized membrane protein YccC [Hymenobacter psychrophilus]
MFADQARQLRYFFSSQEFSDGLRTTLAILVPGLALGWLGQLQAGVTMSVGALCVSLTDTPGPPLHKRNGGVAAVVLTGLMALLTGLVQPYPWLLGALVVAVSFWFTMLLVYGNRAGAVGTAGLLVMILLLDKPIPPGYSLNYAGLVVAGGLWYLALALALNRLRPYREAQQALGEAVLAVAGFLRLKAEFYRSGTNLEADYRRLVAQQVRVSEKQDGVRELLFKTRQLVSESSDTGRRLVLTFVDLVDLYEQITITSYDYAELHRRFEAGGLLDAFAGEIDALAAELERVGFAIQGNYTYHAAGSDPLAGLNQLKARLDALEADPAQSGSVLPLRKVLVNLRNLVARLQDMQGYFAAEAAIATPAARPLQTSGTGSLDLDRFVAHQQFTLRQLTGQLTMRSGIFRHALRMLVASLIGFIITEILSGHHGYWVLMTITYMLKPAFSLTKQRNIQRVMGTLLGGVLGAVMLWLISDQLLLLALMVGFMVVSFSFARINYLVTVVFMTPFVLILFSFLGQGYVRVVQERIFDTVLGCSIAFVVSYALFPRWESEQLQGVLRPVLRANLNYLRTLQQALLGSPIALLDYKLTRKEVYVSSANLGAAFQRMLSEPRAKQRHPAEVHELVVLNHILAANVAAITSALLADEIRPGVSAAGLKTLRQAQQQLRRGLLRLGEPDVPEEFPPAPAPTAETEDAQLGEQLEFIQKLSGDINRITETVAG